MEKKDSLLYLFPSPIKFIFPSMEIVVFISHFYKVHFSIDGKKNSFLSTYGICGFHRWNFFMCNTRQTKTDLPSMEAKKPSKFFKHTQLHGNELPFQIPIYECNYPLSLFNGFEQLAGKIFCFGFRYSTGSMLPRIKLYSFQKIAPSLFLDIEN